MKLTKDLVGCEIENAHQNVHTVDYSSDDSNSSELAPFDEMFVKVQELYQDDSDEQEDDWNWKACI